MGGERLPPDVAEGRTRGPRACRQRFTPQIVFPCFDSEPWFSRALTRQHSHVWREGPPGPPAEVSAASLSPEVPALRGPGRVPKPRPAAASV